jgi:hypothetical protein
MISHRLEHFDELLAVLDALAATEVRVERCGGASAARPSAAGGHLRPQAGERSVLGGALLATLEFYDGPGRFVISADRFDFACWNGEQLAVWIRGSSDPALTCRRLRTAAS